MDGSRARALLGVPPHATTEEVRRVFRRAARRAHPDAGGDAAAFRTVLAARDALVASAGPVPPTTRRNWQRLRCTAAAWAPDPPRPSIDIVDVPRRRATPTPPPTPDFDALLAAALAA